MNVEQAMAYQRMEKRLNELAQDLCNTARSVEEANRFYRGGIEMFHMRMTAKVDAPAFQERIARLRSEDVARLLKKNEGALRAQLGQFGIDPEPIFGDRSDGAA